MTSDGFDYNSEVLVLLAFRHKFFLSIPFPINNHNYVKKISFSGPFNVFSHIVILELSLIVKKSNEKNNTLNKLYTFVAFF